MDARILARVKKDLVRLDKLRSEHKQRADEIDTLEAACLAAMDRLELTKLQIDDNRQAVVVTASKTAVDEDRLIEILRDRIDLDQAQRDSCFKRTVDVTKARKLLGAEALDEISVKVPGEPCIRITGKR